MSFLAGCGFAVVAVLALTNKRMRLLRRKIGSLEAITRRRALTAQEVSHEVKNPITAIICSAEALEHLLRKKITEDELRCLRYIREYADVVLRHVTNYLDLNLADSGSLISEPQVVRPLEVARGVAGLLQSAAMRKAVEITVEGDAQCAVRVDPRHLRQCLFNLIHNAVKFSENGQEIEVSCGEDGRGVVRIDVRDHGVGMSPAQLKALWLGDRRRLQGNRESAGAGLGLQITKKLLELSGGQLSVASRLGEGSCFTLELPSAPMDQHAVTEGSRDELSLQPLQGQSVLLMEPHEGAAGAVGSLVEALGGLVARVSEASAAVQAIESRAYQTVVIDSDLGLEEVQKLAILVREHAPNEETKIVIAGADLAVKGAAALTKPFDGRALVATILGEGSEQENKSGDSSVTRGGRYDGFTCLR